MDSASAGEADAAMYAVFAEATDAATVLANTPFLLTRCSSDLRYLFVSEAYARMIGHQPEEVVGKRIDEIVGETAFQTVLPYIEAVLSGQRVEYEISVPYRDVGPRFVHVIYMPDKDRLGNVRGWVASITDITERKHIEVALRESEQRLRWQASIVESSDDAIVSKNLNGIIQSWNKGAEHVFGYTAEEAIGQPITIVIPADRQGEERDILTRIRRGQRIEHFETVRRRKDGTLIAISLTISPVKNDEGQIVGASKIARDISEQKYNQERIATLAREAEHRSKNMLATVQAAVHLSHSDTPEGLKLAIEGRIRALANVHSLFLETRWIGADLSTIARQELAPYSEKDKAQVQMEGSQVLLEPTTAQAIAVILHELATNAGKYGALSNPSGKIDLQWSHSASGELVIRWTETGGPTVETPKRQGFGGRVVEQLIGQLKGNVHFDWRAEGLVCEVTLPAT
jgi:PAS domain S-box-containing protein